MFNGAVMYRLQLFPSCCVGLNGKKNVTIRLLVNADGFIRTVFYELIINPIFQSIVKNMFFFSFKAAV